MILVPASALFVWQLSGLGGRRGSLPAEVVAESLAPAAVQVESEEAAPFPIRTVSATPPGDPSSGDESPRRRPPTAIDALLALQLKRAKQDWARDPFAPVVTLEPVWMPPEPKVGRPSPAYRLEGVSQTRLPGDRAGDRFVAILSGHLVVVGDRLEGRYEVTAITEDSLTLAEADAEHVFYLERPLIVEVGPPNVRDSGGKP